jgi:hypothetical protein
VRGFLAFGADFLVIQALLFLLTSSL